MQLVAAETADARVGAPRAAWRLARATLHALHGLWLVLLVFPRVSIERRQHHVQWWAAKMLRMLGMRLEVAGVPRPGGGTLVTANHISWLDIMAIHAVCPQARFVSKADVKAWPLINKLVDSAGTLYIERERRRDAMRLVHDVAAVLKAGDVVAVFPEGTTSDGRGLLPFHANLLQAAIAVGVPVQPVALRYRDAVNAVSPAAMFVGETTLAQSMWMIARGRDLVVRVEWLPAQGSRHADRRALAELLRREIGSALGVVIEPVDAASDTPSA
ncbi:lysophospholipid acyltransferase family protein [Rivibacter subsaxonicus]|uniref:Lyso-ornithine lipid acyltransferase n=1 Tax=Rivibacter subsaxonicus TaxID=457575 RepID=A0A4Q7W0M5_9BURK|nr:lysophospholipid acyltransferase family protein [Rivibacter subsaxonicus]RZU02375.1 lyso-ornithine lipid acyltransferase [Rivibacter subsaxonicus]